MKKYLSLFLAGLMIVSSLLVLGSCGKKDDAPEGGSKSVVTLDINPSIELTVDENNCVVGVYGSNEDAKILLSSDVNLKGMKAEDAVKAITELAVDLKFLNDDNTVVGTTVSSTDEKAEEKLKEQISATVKDTAKEKGLTVSTTDGFFFSVTRKYNAFKEANPDSKLTVADFKLALSAADTGLVSLDVAVTLDKEELIRIINEHHEKAEAFITDAFEQSRAAANQAYEKSVGLVNDMIYMKYYQKNLAKHPETFYYGGLYAMYQTSARGIDAMAVMADAITGIYDTELTAEQIETVCKALNLNTEEERKEIANADGTVTVRSIESYADRLLKNMADQAKAEKIAADLTLALGGIEVDLKIEVRNILNKECTECINIMEESKKLVEAFGVLIPQAAKPAYDQFVTDYDSILEKITALKADDKLTADDFREIAALLREKSKALEDKIKIDLTEEERNAIAAEQAEAKAKMDAYKAEFDKAMEKAEAQSKAYLEQARQKRLNAVNG